MNIFYYLIYLNILVIWIYFSFNNLYIYLRILSIFLRFWVFKFFLLVLVIILGFWVFIYFWLYFILLFFLFIFIDIWPTLFWSGLILVFVFDSSCSLFETNINLRWNKHGAKSQVESGTTKIDEVRIDSFPAPMRPELV